MSERNAQIIDLLRRQTEALINDPVRLAEWAEEQRQFQADYEAYMALPTHPADCHCARCMTEFLNRKKED